jgi:bifunctional non-homologous end joining protein LigD
MIGLHRWLSLIQRPENPDIAIIEIHSLSSEYSQVYKAAKLIREELEIAGFQPYLMTTGIGGLYVISKVVYNCSFDDIRHVMYNITLKIANKFPQEFSVDVHKKDRNELVYLDVTRNSYGQSSIVPYSVAPQKNATVATPIHWEEIENSNFSLDQFNINNIFLRLTPNIITS